MITLSTIFFIKEKATSVISHIECLFFKVYNQLAFLWLKVGKSINISNRSQVRFCPFSVILARKSKSQPSELFTTSLQSIFSKEEIFSLIYLKDCQYWLLMSQGKLGKQLHFWTKHSKLLYMMRNSIKQDSISRVLFKFYQKDCRPEVLLPRNSCLIGWWLLNKSRSLKYLLICPYSFGKSFFFLKILVKVWRVRQNNVWKSSCMFLDKDWQFKAKYLQNLVKTQLM